MDIPSWVSEGSIRKYHRAVAQLKTEKKEITDAAIKELYTKWGGLVIDSPVVNEEEVEAPARKGRRA